VWGAAGKVAERKVIVAGLLDDEVVVPVQVDGFRETRLVLAEELPILGAAARPSRRPPSVAFIAPLDPLAWDRLMLRDLFGFSYLWEVYTPAAKRRHGYYVLPLLFGDRFVGRIEPRCERKTRTLHILGIWFEPRFEPMAEPHFAEALRDALRVYRSFVGADAMVWPRTRLGRELARATA
jgi:uncharacterized protein YcaQ